MAVTKTGAMYKGFIFDGVDSKDYGVYVSGSAVYNAPERDVSMIEIPGRNGTFALDNGRFHNITVTYHAGLFGDTETDFAEAISDFRNMLCARKGYCRLTDDYNPDEYRMAVYKSGLEVDVASLEAGQFDIVFECKPQRFLTSGETAVAVANNGTITNPTPFESSPLLKVEGHGDIDIEGQTVTVSGDPIGETLLAPGQTRRPGGTISIDVDDNLFNAGDTITVNGTIYFEFLISPKTSGITFNTRNSPAHMPAKTISGFLDEGVDILGGGSTNETRVAYTNTAQTFTAGTAKTLTATQTWYCDFDKSGTQYDTEITITERIIYDGAKQFKVLVSGMTFNSNLNVMLQQTDVGSIYVDSSIVPTSSGVYIDCDLGEAYIIENGEISSVNSSVTLPAELPTLAPGSNEITYDNTITSFKVTPRWWQV